MTLTFSKGEYGFNLTFPTIYDHDGVTVKDLTGYTVTFVMKDATLLTNKVNSACSVSGSNPNWTVNYLVQATDFDTVGTFNASLILTKSGDREETGQFVIVIKNTNGP